MQVNEFFIGHYGNLIGMETIHDRLRKARRAANFLTAQDAADSMGIPYPTYAGHENGSAGIRSATAQRYAKKFRVSLEWLLVGTGPGPGEQQSHGLPPVDFGDDDDLDLQIDATVEHLRILREEQKRRRDLGRGAKSLREQRYGGERTNRVEGERGKTARTFLTDTSE